MKIETISKLGFDIVHGCQLRCLGCPNSVLKPKIKQINPEDFDACLKNIDIKHVGLFRLFNFGEPLLHKLLPEVILKIPQQSWSVDIVEISTNGQYHDFEILAETMRTGVLNRLAASCDGDGTAEDYERLRPPGKWDKFIEFLAKANELRNKYAPQIKLINRIVCTDPVAQNRWRKTLEPLGWSPEFRDWLILPQGENMLNREPVVPNRICSFMSGEKLYVDYDGTVVPCCAHPQAGVLGNLHENRFSEILTGLARQKMLIALATHRHDMKICNECEF